MIICYNNILIRDTNQIIWPSNYITIFRYNSFLVKITEDHEIIFIRTRSILESESCNQVEQRNTKFGLNYVYRLTMEDILLSNALTY